MRTLPATTNVVVVGAGPTGLALPCVLASEGVSFVLVDQLAAGANTSRAAVVHARTLEVLEELKVTDRLRAEGHIVPQFTVRDRDHVLATIRFDQLRTRYAYTPMVPQNITEAILLGRLRELGSDVYHPFTRPTTCSKTPTASRLRSPPMASIRRRSAPDTSSVPTACASAPASASPAIRAHPP